MRTAIAAAFLVAPLASAQVVGLSIHADRPVLMPGESALVTVTATFPEAYYALAGARFDFRFDDGDLDPRAAWNDYRALPPFDGPQTPPELTEVGIFGNVLGQLNFPPAMIYADPTNPVDVWEVTFTAPLGAGGGYRVDMLTDTHLYDVYIERESSTSIRITDLVTEGEASIFVVPAPASAAVLALGLSATRRRRERPARPQFTAARASVKAARASVKATRASVKAARTPVKAARSSVKAARTSVKATRTSVKAARTSVKAARTPVKATRTSVKAARRTVIAVLGPGTGPGSPCGPIRRMCGPTEPAEGRGPYRNMRTPPARHSPVGRTLGKTMIRTTLAALASTAAVLATTTASHAQMPGEVVIEIDQPVLAPGESTTVRLWAGFDSTRDYAVAGVVTSLLADSGGVDVSAAWSDVSLVHPMAGPGTTIGTPDAGGYAGIIAGQINFPVSGGTADPSDPIAFWEATFTAPTDASAFAVDLSTRTDRFDVYIERDSSRAEPRLDGLTEGAGRITIVPAPASGLVLALGLAAMRRRR